MPQHRHTNKLIHESSPYLLQHAHNPVDWYAWGSEAFAKAKREDKLLLVSIGYSSCHWCHVMERESFEDEETAVLMNELFVCVKVDREERPDIDQLYMDAVQLISGRGGWPLNCFVLPDGRPLHGGTYFPKNDWQKVLRSLADFYKTKKEEAFEYATELTNGLKKLDVLPVSATTGFNQEKLQHIVAGWKAHIDRVNGGYNWTPKFPMPNNWDFFLQYAVQQKDEELEKAVYVSLQKMANGGLYDQLGGGFARYSTDAFWKVPHFEKMLYDNAQLMSLYAKAWLQNPDPLFRKVVYETHEFLIREFTDARGYFYSAIDADSDGVEGKFYTWSKEELQEMLGEHESLFSLYYSVDAYGNWEHTNILYKSRSNDELEKLTGKSIGEIEMVVQWCCAVLRAVRQKRVSPGLDDKFITSWNALQVTAYCHAYRSFGEETFKNAAIRCADFMIESMMEGRQLYRIHKDGKRTVPAFAEDYAMFCEALIELYQISFDEQYLIQANELMEESIAQFYDVESNLFYVTAANTETLAVRRMDFSDDVMPSANSVFASCLQALQFYFSKNDYEQMLQQMLMRIESKAEKSPMNYSNWIRIMQNKLKGVRQLVISGDKKEPAMKELQKKYRPGTLYALTKANSQIPMLQDKTDEEQTMVYLCIDQTCRLPVAAETFDF